MRAGELTTLRWDQVYDKHVHLPTTKSNSPRDVPLSKKAKEILQTMQGWDDEIIFGISSDTLSSLFRKYRKRADLEGFVWHDTVTPHLAQQLLVE